MQNADELWLESCGILDISAASQAPGHNRDTPCTSPGFDIRASCLWGSEIDAVRPPPVLSAELSLITRTAGFWSGGKSRGRFSSLCHRRTDCARQRLESSQTDGQAAVGTHRRSGESRRGGVVLCNGSCRDLPVTCSITATQSIPARHPLWNAQRRSRQVSAALERPFMPVD